ncbi:MAG TPA: M50 family metallopeptidase [Candidatus Saccharibacteria bacterium]|nr:M50 family metallopeptidase [Candidatus Saccharibacteria bacterium]HRQ06904.1 M50 family metallopeptidase [Candidatus Saccharibacteria bacterium]
MELILGVAVGLIILVILVVVHELGHAISARRNGVVVEEFGIGFPPRAWKKKLKNGILFTLNWLPLGGFVKLQGEHDASEGKGDYGAATFWQKTRILLAGVTINWLVAALLFTILALTGLPKALPDQFVIPSDTTMVRQPVEITAVSPGYPAEKAGLKSGDTIVRFDGQEVPTAERLIELTKADMGKTVTVIYNRAGVEHSTQVTLRDDDSGPILGAGLGQRELIKTSWSAPIVGVATAGQFTWATLQGLGGLVVNLSQGLVSQLSPDSATREHGSQELKEVGDSVAGPIGILGTIFPAANAAGPTQLVFLTAVISLTLAVMNALPIPALDGGRWTVMTIFRLLKKKLTKEREEKIQTVGFLILMALIILVTITDVTKFF